MNKKGFTLIELLAVIILLTLIITVVTRSVNVAINSSKSSISKTQKEALENAAQIYHIEENISLDCVSINNLYNMGYIEKDDVIDPKTKKELDGSIKIENRNGKYKYIYQEKECSVYKNGTPIYFDVNKGEICTEEIYNDSYDETKNDYLNSSTGYNGITETNEKQNSCLKFYVFNDDRKDTIDLILDHNTTVDVMWNSSGKNTNGPKEIIEELKNDTKDWKGTIEPSLYTIDHRGKASNAFYTIDYEGINARLITAEDIAKIGNTMWFGDSISININDNLWLFDRVSSNCTSAGCENNSDDASVTGYYTVSSIYSTYSSVLSLLYSTTSTPHFEITPSGLDMITLGIRPVITISKSKF